MSKSKRNPMNINAGNQRSVAVSTVNVLCGDITAAPVLAPVGDLAARQAALVLALGGNPWISRTVAGRVLSARSR